jgi:hypothetical protein
LGEVRGDGCSDHGQRAGLFFGVLLRSDHHVSAGEKGKHFQAAEISLRGDSDDPLGIPGDFDNGI